MASYVQSGFKKKQSVYRYLMKIVLRIDRKDSFAPVVL